MKKYSVFMILICFVCAGLYAEEVKEWKPADHPAMLTRSMTGFTEPRAFMDVKAEYAGRLLKWSISEGSEVKGAKDQKRILLAQQDDRLAKLSVSKEEASLESQKQLLKTRQAEEALLVREVAFRKLEMDRIAGLAKEGKVPVANFDQAVFDFDRTKLALQQAKENVALQKQAVLEQEVNLEQAQEILSRYQLMAPKGWVLNERVLEESSWVNAGQVVARLCRYSHLFSLPSFE